MFKRALAAEVLKIRRTIALKMVLVAPLAVVGLTLFIASQAPFTTLRHGASTDRWKALTRANLQFWGLLMLPLYMTLQTALVAGLDHAENQWKALFARPVARWNVYAAKLLVVAGMVLASSALLVAGVAAEGMLLRWLLPEVGFTPGVPLGDIALQGAQMTALLPAALAVQHWVSLRWRSFSIAVGFGIVAMTTGFAMLLAAGQYGGWPQYFPWSLPMLVLARQPPNLAVAISVGAVVAVGVSVVCCAEFCRRDVG